MTSPDTIAFENCSASNVLERFQPIFDSVLLKFLQFIELSVSKVVRLMI